MTRLFSIHEVAELEINEAADFYDLESPGPAACSSRKLSDLSKASLNFQMRLRLYEGG